jgi:hypothetical protein
MEWSGACPARGRKFDLATERRNIAFGLAQQQEMAKQRLQYGAHLTT